MTKQISFKLITEIVAESAGISVASMKVSGRQHRRVAARYVSVYFASRHTGMSMSWISRALGYADHTTVVYAVKRVKNVLETQKTDIAGAVTQLIREIHNKSAVKIKAAIDTSTKINNKP